MLDYNILDHTAPPPPPPKKPSVLHKLALAVEIGAWIFLLFGLGRMVGNTEGDSFNSIGSMFGKSAPLYAHFFLIVFYLLFAVLIFRSFGWKQHLFAQCCGLTVSLYLVGVVFVLESWTGAKELLWAVFSIALVFCIVGLVLSSQSKDKQVLNFLLGVFIRMGIIALLNGFYLFS